MVNDNTQQKGNSVSESSIYLKKSELPKNISSFKNDVGYISSVALGNWLKEHSYISKNEITALIKKANLTIVDTINKTSDDEAISRLNQDIIGINREILEIKDKLSNVEASSISVEEKNSFAKKTDIPTKVSQLENDRHFLTTHQSLANYARKSDIPDVSNFVTRDEIPVSTDGFATKDWVDEQGFLKSHQSLSAYAKKSDIPDVSEFITRDDIPSVDGLASKDWVMDQGFLTQHQSLSKYAKKSELPDVSQFVTKDEIPSIDGLATKEWVESNGYLKNHQSLQDYVKKSELPDVSNFITEEWIQEQGFISEVQDLEEFVKKSDIPSYLSDYVKSSTLNSYAKKNSVYNKSYIDSNFLSKKEAEIIYPSKEYADNKYLSKSDARKIYLNIEDYSAIKDASVISKEYSDKTLEELEANLQYLRNGFYIVNNNDIVIVKDHKIISLFENGTPQSVLEWIEEE